jgi:hypothetical protein
VRILCDLGFGRKAALCGEPGHGSLISCGHGMARSAFIGRVHLRHHRLRPLRRVAPPPWGEGGRMRQWAASAVRPLQCQPPIGPSPPRPAVARTCGNLRWHCWREYPPRHEHTTTISGRAADDAGKHQRRAVARRVVLAVPPPDDRRPTELAGAAGAGEPDQRAMAMRPRKRALHV